MNAHDVILDIVRKAYQLEVDGFTFYSMTAAKTDKPAVRELFEKLAQDETEHQAYLKEVLRDFDQKGSAAFQLSMRNPDLGAFMREVFTDRFRQQAQGAEFETAVLSIGMQLESNAVQYFTRAGQRAGEHEVREFYDSLAEWEKQHLDALQRLYNAVRVDYWAEAGFAPF